MPGLSRSWKMIPSLAGVVGRLSMTKVEIEVRKNLRLLELSPQQMFKEVTGSMFS